MTGHLDHTVSEIRAQLPVLLTVAEAAEVSRCSASSVRRAIEAGKLPFNQRGGEGGALYLPRDAVLDWAFALESKPAPSKAQPRPSHRRGVVSSERAQGMRRLPKRLAVGGTSVARLTPETMHDLVAGYVAG